MVKGVPQKSGVFFITRPMEIIFQSTLRKEATRKTMKVLQVGQTLCKINNFTA
jgi:hypothetical protein